MGHIYLLHSKISTSVILLTSNQTNDRRIKLMNLGVWASNIDTKNLLALFVMLSFYLLFEILTVSCDILYIVWKYSHDVHHQTSSKIVLLFCFKHHTNTSAVIQLYKCVPVASFEMLIRGAWLLYPEANFKTISSLGDYLYNESMDKITGKCYSYCYLSYQEGLASYWYHHCRA